MHWYDKKFPNYKKHYILQTLMATIYALGVLVALGGYQHAELLGIIGFTSLGSSAFIAFGSYNVITACARNMLGGYLTSIVVGIVCWNVASWCAAVDPALAQHFLFEIFAALAVGLSMLIMTVFDLEHPPAAGLALGLVVEVWSWHALVTILVAVIVLVLLWYWLRHWLISLI